MVKVTERQLPHGNVPAGEIRDGTTREWALKTSENVVELKRQLKEVQLAVQELQRKVG